MRTVATLAIALVPLLLAPAGMSQEARGARAARPAVAESVESHERPAAYVSRSEHGYSAAARRIADCLATYPGYDVRTDRVPAGQGASRRCPL